MLRKIASGIMFTMLLTGMLASAPNVPQVEASETIYIRADGSVDPPTAPIERDGDLYTLTDNITIDTGGIDGIVIERRNMTLDGAGYTLQGMAGGNGINLTRRRLVTIKNIEITGFGQGIYLYDASNNTISGNRIANTWNGTNFWYSSNNSMFGNRLTGNNIAIALYIYSHNNSIVRNSMTNNGGGILSYRENNGNSILGNNMTDNDSGVCIIRSSGNIVAENKISDNLYGLGVQWSSNNRIFHNNIIENTYQADIQGSGYFNLWDDGYPSGGNYWSDYSGSDPDSDGIGDMPYEIDVDNVDNYPLMNRYIAGDVNYDGIVNTFDLSSLATGYGTLPDSPDWNVRADLNDDLIVSAVDLFILGKNFGKTGL